MRILVPVFLLFFASAYSADKPNIVVFLVDDMGWQDTSVPFWKETTSLNKRYRTPNMERLAREGVIFTNAYSTPVCTPTRVSIMTGMNAAHHGVTNWTHVEKDHPTDMEDEMFRTNDWNYNGLDPRGHTAHAIHATPLPQLLKEHGYYTVHIGKAHWGSMGTPGSNPHNLGFMVNVAGNATGHPQSFQGKDNYGNLSGKTTHHAVQDLSEYYGSETFLTEALTREAIKAIDAPVMNRQPFFLHFAHYAVHTPLQADQKYYQKYIDQGLNETEARYASMIEGMDQSLGEVLDYLEAKGILNKTIVIFMTDNGGLSLVPLRGGEAHTHNLPLRAGKGSVYEGGIRVPMIVRWDKAFARGSRIDQYVIAEDLFPSILELAGIRNGKTLQQVDGQSFVPLLRGKSTTDSRPLIWHFPHKWQPDGPGINYKSAIRLGDWKLVYHMRTGQRELFNLADDIEEKKDLASQNPVKVDELSKILRDKLRGWNAPMPVDLKTGRRLELPSE